MNIVMLVKICCKLQIRVFVFRIFLDFSIDNFHFSSQKNIYCEKSLEVLHRGAFIEYPQYMFSWRNRKNITLITSLT